MITWHEGYELVCFAPDEEDDVEDGVSSLEHPSTTGAATTSAATTTNERPKSISPSVPQLRGVHERRFP